MRKDFGAKPFLYPQPVLMIATYGEDGTPDVMNAAWGGIADMKRVAMYLSASHKTVKKHPGPEGLHGEHGGCGPRDGVRLPGHCVGQSGAGQGGQGGVPCDQECPCGRPAGRRAAPGPGVPFVSFDEESELLVGEIVNVSVDESAMTDGKVDVAKVAPITFDPFNNAYHVLGEKVGNAFSDGMALR